MKRKIGLLILTISMALTLMVIPSFAVDGKEDRALDVVLVLDQSGSMKENDPDGLMKDAAKTFISMLPLQSRANIITFNRSRTKWKDGLTSLDDNSKINSAAKWIDDVKYTGDTDMSNAVADAIEMFDVNDGRVHAILLLSDGRNDFGYELDKEKESDARLNQALVTAKNSGIQIYCIGYGDEMANTNDTPYQKLDSIAIANSQNRITTKTDASSIGDYFNIVIAELMGSNTVTVVDNEIQIAPNVKEANINITSNSKLGNAGISLINSDGDEVDFKDDQVARLYMYEYSCVIKLYDPKPGKYIIETSQDVLISATYIPYYDYVLENKILDSNGNEVDHINNGDTFTIETVINQDGKPVTTADTYANLNAKVVVTAKDTKESQEVPLSFVNGRLTAKMQLDHVATYGLDVLVESDSFKLNDYLEIQADKQPIAIDKKKFENKIGEQTLDKTFKSSVTKDISMKTLNSVIDDPDDVGFEVTEVKSNNPDDVEAKLTKNGLTLTGKNWGSATVTLTYEDEMGNTVESSFAVKVVDKALVVFFAAIPFLIGLIILGIVILILRKSRLIKGTFTITNITVENDLESYAIGTIKEYPSNIFLKRKKTLATGIMQYVQDIYNETANEKTYTLYNLLQQNNTIKKALESVKFIGTYLGRNGCKIVVKNPNVSYNNNMQYGMKIKESWKQTKDFTVYVKDETGLVLCINGTYRSSILMKKDSFDPNMEMFNQNDPNPNKDSFNDFDDFTF